MFEAIAAQAAGKFASSAAQSMFAPGGPTVSGGGPVSNRQDGSGWTVATGGASASGRQDKGQSLLPSISPDVLMWAGVAALAFLAVRKLKKKG